MKHNQKKIRGITLVLILFMLAGCAAPKATPVPTTVIQSCPTAADQSCPTAVAQASAEHGTMWDTLRGVTNNTITFSPGNKCSLGSAKSVNAGDLTYEILVTSLEHQNYYLAIYTINPGHTFADIQALPDTNTDPPSFIHLVSIDHVLPGSDSIHSLGNVNEGPLYFSCMAHDPNYDKRFADLGPVEVVP
jgi:hypothetical protein